MNIESQYIEHWISICILHFHLNYDIKNTCQYVMLLCNLTFCYSINHHSITLNIELEILKSHFKLDSRIEYWIVNCILHCQLINQFEYCIAHCILHCILQRPFKLRNLTRPFKLRNLTRPFKLRNLPNPGSWQIEQSELLPVIG